MSEHASRRSTTGSKPLADFKVANAVPVEVMLSHLTIEVDGGAIPLREYFKLDEKRGEWVGWCPFGDQHGKADSFNINNEAGRFFCRTEHHKEVKERKHSGGNVLTFASKYRKEGLRDAGLWLEGLAGSERVPEDAPVAEAKEVLADAKKVLAVLASEDEVHHAIAHACELIIVEIGKHADSPQELAKRYANVVLDWLRL